MARRGYNLILLLLLAACAAEKPTPPAATLSTAFRMGALGDSITRAADAVQFAFGPSDYLVHLEALDETQLLKNARDHESSLSWSTGDAAVLSNGTHFNLLTAAGAAVTTDIQAVDGDKSSDLATQTAKLLGNGTPDYVTLLVGGNDLCRNPTPGTPIDDAAFYTNVRSAVQSLIAASSGIRILVVGIPPVADLFNHRNDKIAGSSISCLQLWTELRNNPTLQVELCDPVFFATSSSDVGLLNVISGRNAANTRLANLPTEFPSNVKFASSIANETTIPSDQISQVDCFHPSVKGQKHLGQTTWAEGWYVNGL